MLMSSRFLSTSLIALARLRMEITQSPFCGPWTGTDEYFVTEVTNCSVKVKHAAVW